MNSCNNQSNLFTKGTFTIRKMGLNYYSINSFKNDKEKCKSVNHINLNSYKLFIALFFYFSYFLLQNMIQPKNKISELNLIKDNLRIMFEGQGEANKDVSDMNQIKLISLDDENESNDENDDISENENNERDYINLLDLSNSTYNIILNYLEQKSYNITHFISDVFFQWHFGFITRNMDDTWKEERFDIWYKYLLDQSLEYDKEIIEEIKIMITNPYPDYFIEMYCREKKLSWERRMQELKNEWIEFIYESLEIWETEKDNREMVDEEEHQL
ncbi:Plasmodium exported protein, unknown function [Plasmodium relictum]|uniref:Plasmodium RESA N-terminal domain-containing protein n=1 Tax=Plasmodium relictum TaxID=85471 RepID=A0A1J1GPE9_PLARL|nr:Plasmodium exported protein, unknown function [Plasmodium relictum]CRG85429.1 Plasmodium exported protein, unknown function [Plasmodium relictum]